LRRGLDRGRPVSELGGGLLALFRPWRGVVVGRPIVRLRPAELLAWRARDVEILALAIAAVAAPATAAASASSAIAAIVAMVLV
jgi:hypothetical protein